MDDIRKKAKSRRMRVVLPEPEDERILAAAVSSHEQGIAIPILVGEVDSVRNKASGLGLSLDGIQIIDPLKSDYFEAFVQNYLKLRGNKAISEAVARRILSKPLYFACMMLRSNLADAVVAGAVNTTANVIKASHLILGYSTGILTPSSFFVMETNKKQFGEKGTLMYTDAAVNPDPTAEQLADIAIATGRSARSLLGWEPRIAMLSFSTKGSANHPLVDKVIRATEIAKTKAPEMDVDGELQADSAIVPEVAKKKIREPGLVAGRANILVFPDLNAGNIAYKLTQYLGGAKAYGPILQGFSKPISDLSRGAKIEDVVGVIAIVCVLSQSEK